MVPILHSSTSHEATAAAPWPRYSLGASIMKATNRNVCSHRDTIRCSCTSYTWVALCWNTAGPKSPTRCAAAKFSSIVQHHAEEGIVDVDLAVVLDEAQFPEFVHEKINARARRANHLREHLLRYFGEHLLRLARIAIAREEQQGARQALLAGVEELVDEVFLYADVSCQHMGDKTVRELMFSLQRPNHLVFFNDHYGGGCDGGRRRHANRLARQTAFAQKITGSQDRHNRFLAGFIHHRKLNAAFLNVNDILGGVALRKDRLFRRKLGYFSPQTGGVEKKLQIERRNPRKRLFGGARNLDGYTANCGR